MNNETVDKKITMSLLFDQYKELLTKKQREYFNLYMNEDLSLNEIADEYKVSKNAIFDSINKTEKNLEEFESKLNLVDKNRTITDIVNMFQNDDDQDIQLIVAKLKEVIS